MNSQTVRPMLVSFPKASWTTSDGVSDRFPAGLRVLVVDDDSTCLRILDSMLKKCGYEVTQKHDAGSALDLLRRNKGGYDIVMSDVHMPDMDGFKLLEHIGLEMDLPVIMMSADDSKNIVMKGVTHGACDYLIKPISMEALKNIWQHVFRKKKQELKEKDFEGSEISEDGEQRKSPENIGYSSSANETNFKNFKKRKDEEDEEERDDTSTLKKPRVVWSADLHQQFVNAVRQLGIDKAVPKRILELMNVPGLTRENVASHLQKFRLYLRRASEHQDGPNDALMRHPEASFRPIPSINDLQALASTGQIPAQSISAFQVAALSRPNMHSVPIIDQRNPFSFGIQKLTSGNDKLQRNNNVKQMNLFHGIPTSTEPKQIAPLQQFGQSFGAVNMLGHSPAQMDELQERTQVFNDINGGDHLSSLASSVSQPNLVQVTLSGVHGPVYSSVSNPSTPPGDSFPLMSNCRNLTVASKGMLQEEAHSEMKASIGFISSYDAFSGLGNSPNTILPVNLSAASNALKIKGGRLLDMGFQKNPFPGQFGEDDLISALFKQQEGMELVDNEFDGYHPNNFPLQ